MYDKDVIALTLPKDGGCLLSLNSLWQYLYLLPKIHFIVKFLLPFFFITFNFEEHTTHVLYECITEWVFMCILV